MPDFPGGSVESVEDAPVLDDDAAADAGAYLHFDDRPLVFGQYRRVAQRADIGVVLHTNRAAKRVLHVPHRIERIPAGHDRRTDRRILTNVDARRQRQYGMPQRQVGIHRRCHAPQLFAHPGQKILRSVVGYRNHMPFVCKQPHVHVGDAEHGVPGAHVGHGDQTKPIVDHQSFRRASTVHCDHAGSRQHSPTQQPVHA